MDSLPPPAAAAPTPKSESRTIAASAAGGAATPRSAPSATAAGTVEQSDPFARMDRMDWPGPNRYRSASGQPGPDYWQQRADYNISATLDTMAQSVSGHVVITYTNNSPDTLTFVWLQLDQNLYREASVGSALNADESRFAARGFEGGYEIRNVTVNGKAAPFVEADTRMWVALGAPLAPRGAHATIGMDFRFAVPEHGSDRLARDGRLYELGQWYPRMAVYDDVRGWNTDPYLGQGEFYLEYGDCDYAITAPAGYTIAGSGVLQNPQEVLTAVERTRLAEAAHAGRVVPVIAAGEDSAAVRAGTKTWRFRAQNVRDVAWAGAPDFRWDATSWNGILMHAFYESPKAGRAWEHGAEWTRWSIRFYSQLIAPYPYPQATSVAGPVGGMEYPMFVMVHTGESPADTASVFGTLDHEQGHEWFPMLVGSNERRYGWMDEGIDTYINSFSLEAHGPDSVEWSGNLEDWRQVVANGTQAPLMMPPDRISAGAYGAIAYSKPAVVLLTLRNHVVGRAAFDEALREYARRWAFKHPTPADFFRTVENVTGYDLAWFWRAFFYSKDVLDIGVDTAYTVITRSGPRAVIRLTKHTSIPFPVELRIKLSDGSVRDIKLPVDIWAGTDRYDAMIPVRAPIVGVRLWPDRTVPDWQPANDIWGDAPAPNAPGPVTAGGLASPLNNPP